MGTIDPIALMSECRSRMPSYMVPASIEVVVGPLPRNPNGKIDRKLLSTEWAVRSGKEPNAA
jgi:acyl-CoA synthetase (AMP-forming)/AMP-acid ligase II